MAVLIALGACLYLAAVVSGVSYIRGRDERDLRIFRALLVAAIGAHAAALALNGIARGAWPLQTLHEVDVALGAALAASALAIGLWKRMPLLPLAAAPLAFLLTILSLMPPGAAGSSLPAVKQIWTAVHTMAFIVAYVFCALAFLTGLIYLLEQRALKRPEGRRIFGITPSLETLASINAWSAAVGFALMTMGILVAYLQSRAVLGHGPEWRLDPKILLSTLAWLAYLIVWLMRFVPACKGRWTAAASVAGFGFVVTAFWATLFWSGFHRFV